MRSLVAPTAEQQDMYALAKATALRQTPYVGEMILILVPHFVEGADVVVDEKARLFVGTDLLAHEPGNTRHTRRVAQHISDRASSLFKDHPARIRRFPNQNKAAVAATIELTRTHDHQLVPPETRAEDTFALYHEQFGLDPSEGLPLELLYDMLPDPPDDAEPPVEHSGDGGEESSGADDGPQGDESADGGPPPPPKPHPGRTGLEVATAQQRTARAIMAATGAGAIPGGMKRWAERTAVDAVVPWEESVVNMLHGSFSRTPGSMMPVYHVVSRQQAGVGFGLGVPVLPGYLGPSPLHVLYIDASASMRESDLGDVLAQIAPLFEDHNATVQVWVGDADKTEVALVTGLEELAALLVGNGGTNFVSVFERWASLPADEQPDSVTFFTDGIGPAPAECPFDCDVNWVLMGDPVRRPNIVGTRDPIQYGNFLRIPPSAGASNPISWLRRTPAGGAAW